MIEVKQNVRIHNRYDLELIDARSGIVKQTAQAENVACDAWMNEPDYLYINFNYQCRLGTGTGTPASTDTGLFRQAFGMTGGSVISTSISFPTSKQVKSFTFPATSSYVGKLTEIGLFCQNRICSHAMLADAEGNPIVIEKTEFDILVVTATIYVTISSSGKFIPQKTNNAFFRSLADSASSNVLSYLRLLSHATAKTAGINNSVPASGSHAHYNNSIKGFIFPNKRLNTGDSNIGWVNGIYCGAPPLWGYGWIKLPDEDIFPPFEWKDLSIGTGDGETKEFKCPWSNFIKDSEVIYKNGVALTRGVDYTVDNCNAFHDAMSTLNFAEVASPTHYFGDNYSSVRSGRMLTTEQPYVNGGVLEYYLSDKIVAHLADPDPIKGRRINSLFLRGIGLQDGNSYGRSGGNRNSTFRIVLEKSDDGETWEQFFETPDLHPWVQSNHYIDADYSFELVEAEYIRISFKAGSTGVFSASTPIAYLGRGTDSYNSIWLDYVGEGIVFTEAPAEGDVLTMDCMLDRPYKNSNFVMDVAATFTFA